MIRKFTPKDIDSVMELWLEGNLSAHDFIEAGYWKCNFDFVKKSILFADVYVYETDGHIIAFAGITDDFIAGFFVKNTYRSKGAGSKLISYLKEIYDKLSLCAYVKNEGAVRFYKKHGFEIKDTYTDENTSEEEFLMVYKKLT